MAVTQTASLAQPAIPIKTPVTSNFVMGNWKGTLSASGSGMVFLAKIPPTCLVNIIERHTSGATACTLNIGIRQGNSTSLTASALVGSSVQAERATLGKVYKCVREDTTNESYKYVVATLQAGSVTASVEIDYTIMYNMDDST